MQNFLNAQIAELEDTLEDGLSDLSTTLITSTTALQDAIDALTIEAGTSDAEVIAARNRIRYLAGSPPDVLGDTIEHLGRNQIHVDAYGAVGDGSTNDVVAIQAALNAAVAGDAIVFSAGKTYLVPTTLTIADDNIALLGYGATLDASDLDNDTVGVNACINVTSVDKVSIIGLTLIGPDITGSTDILLIEGNTTGIYLSSCNDCMVRDCRMEGFFRGGIFVFVGNNHTISGNHLHRVRYRLPELGSIAIQASEGTTVVGNVITGVWGSGIAAQNSSKCTIQGNTVQGIDWTVEAEAQSMGICTYNCSYLSIVGNVIERVTDEGIVMTSGGGTDTATKYNTITGNIIINPKLFGICLRAISGASGNNHYANYNTVSNNVVVCNAERTALGADSVIAYYIDSSTTGAGFNFADGNKFDGNMAVSDGFTISHGVLMTGSNITRTSVINNILSACNYGIEVLSANSLIANNAAHASLLVGIRVRSSSNNCLVQGNKVTGTPATKFSIVLEGALTSTKIVHNFIDTPVDVSGATGSAYFINNNHREDMVSSGIGTLSAGTVNITGMPPTLTEGAITLVRKTPASTPANTGALYVSNIDQVTFNRVTVTSTNASDNGTFYWFLNR